MIFKKNWKILLGIITTLLGIIGGLITINQYFSETPKLSSSVIKIELKIDYNCFFTNIKEDLNSIEERHRDFTDYVIIDLIREIKIISESKLQETGFEENLSEENLSQNLGKLFNEAIKKINKLEQEWKEYEEDEDYKPELDQIKNKLTRIRDRNIPIDQNAKRVEIELLVENDSRLQNGIYKTAIIRFYENKSVSMPLTLTLTSEKDNQKPNDTSIDDKSFKMFELISPTMKSLSYTERQIVKSAFENKYAYILAVKDINGRIWPTKGEILGFNFDQNEEQLKRETSKILNKEFNPTGD